MVGGDVAQNAPGRSDLNGAVVWDDLLVLATRSGCHPEVGTALPSDDIAQLPQFLRLLTNEAWGA
jgi:hypothetical protein